MPHTEKVHSKPIRTNTSNMAGSIVMTGVEQALLHPLDTIAKANMAQSRTFSFNNMKGLYDGFAIGLLKKCYMRGAYKWPANAFFNVQVASQYGDSFNDRFGPKYGKLAVTTCAAVATGLFEPLFVHPVDTLQVRLQAKGSTEKTALSFKNIRELGVSGLYRGALLTGVLRNVPGCLGLFSGSHIVNSALDNDDRSSITKNLFAKWCGALASILLSQPGDVVKTNMQVHGLNFMSACKAVPLKEMMTRGLTARLGLSVKVGLGFFMAEAGMDLAGGLMNGYQSAEIGEAATQPRPTK
jgi:hypothetical protein